MSASRHSRFKRYFDEDEPDDVLELLHVTALLDTTEFQVFKLAREDWVGERVDEAVVEPYFVAYMFKGVVPSWVRHYNRKVLEIEARNELNPRTLGVHHRLASKRMRRLGQVYIVALILVSGWITWMAFNAGEEIKMQREAEAASIRHTHNALP